MRNSASASRYDTISRFLTIIGIAYDTNYSYRIEYFIGDIFSENLSVSFRMQYDIDTILDKNIQISKCKFYQHGQPYCMYKIKLTVYNK